MVRMKNVARTKLITLTGMKLVIRGTKETRMISRSASKVKSVLKQLLNNILPDTPKTAMTMESLIVSITRQSINRDPANVRSNGCTNPSFGLAFPTVTGLILRGGDDLGIKFFLSEEFSFLL